MLLAGVYLWDETRNSEQVLRFPRAINFVLSYECLIASDLTCMLMKQGSRLHRHIHKANFAVSHLVCITLHRCLKPISSR
jgi:hypothetical protein